MKNGVTNTHIHNISDNGGDKWANLYQGRERVNGEKEDNVDKKWMRMMMKRNGMRGIIEEQRGGEEEIQGYGRKVKWGRREERRKGRGE